MSENAKSRITNFTVISLWIVTMTIILSPNIAFLKSLGDFAVQLMLGIFTLGFIFFLSNYKSMFLHSFICSAALCLFLKSASNENLKLPAENESVSFTIAHINLGSAEDNYTTLLDEINERRPDIISLQELTPGWSKLLENKLEDTYSYFIQNVRIDPYGMAIFSKYPITHTDTIQLANTPILQSQIQLPEDHLIKLTNTLLMPAINKSMDSIQNQQLHNLRHIVKNDYSQNLVVGDFNMVYWSSRIRDFRNFTGLLNSRRDISQSVLSVPYDHIFYDDKLECIKFEDFIDNSGHRLGIIGTYQYKTESLEL